MLKHYLTIALRNIRRFALQNAVSILGLTAGFVCLTLSTVWIHFEESFDTFHKDADRLYYMNLINKADNSEPAVYGGFLGYVDFYDFEKAIEFSEIESWCKYLINEHEGVRTLKGDTAFFKMFEFRRVSGDERYMTDSSYIAVTQNFAKKVYGSDNPVGKFFDGKTVCAVIEPLKGPSILSFDVLMWHDFPFLRMDEYDFDWATDDMENIVIFKLHKGVDSKQLSERITKKLDEDDSSSLYNYELLPINQFHRHSAQGGMYIQYIHSRLFVTACLLLLICAIVNYILFSLNRVRNRAREMALRMVHGASDLSIAGMMVTEYALVLGCSLILGLLLVLFLIQPFRDMTDVQMTGGYVFGWSLLMMVVLFTVSVAVCVASTIIVRHRTMQTSISRKSSRLFSNVSIGIQIFISVMFVYAVSVMLYQFRFLRNNDWGVRINDTAVLSIFNPAIQEGDRFDQGWLWLPSLADDDAMQSRWGVYGNNRVSQDYMSRLDALYGLNYSLENLPAAERVFYGIGDIRNIFEAGMDFRRNGRLNKYSINGINRFDAKVLDVLEDKTLELMSLNILDGSLPDRKLTNDEIVITRNLQRELGLGNMADEPTITIEFDYSIGGNSFNNKNIMNHTFRVIAIVSDIYPLSYNSEPGNYILCAPGNPRLIPTLGKGWSKALYTITYKHGMKDELKQQIEKVMSQTELDYKLEFTEDTFYADLESERHLATLIEILGLVCLLISISGIFSIITLSCQERKREIALRKVHGAHVRDILNIFAREYGVLFLISSVLAFIAGYIAIHRWMQQFPRQTAISWWIYTAIFALMALIICITVGNRVLTAARENPADVIKSE